MSLEPIYEALRARGFHHEAEAGFIGGVPVQFIPAYKKQATEALEQAEERIFDGVPTWELAHGLGDTTRSIPSFSASIILCGSYGCRSPH